MFSRRMRRAFEGWRPALLAATLAALLLGAALWGARTTTPGAPSTALRATAEAQASVEHWSARVAADPADFVAREQLAGALLRRFAQSGDIELLRPALGAAEAAVDLAPAAGSGAYATLVVKRLFAEPVRSRRRDRESAPRRKKRPARASEVRRPASRREEPPPAEQPERRPARRRESVLRRLLRQEPET